MHTDLVLLLMVLVVALVLPTSVICWVAARRLERARARLGQTRDLLHRAHPDVQERLTRARIGTNRAVTTSTDVAERLVDADAAMAGLSRRLREGRGSIDEATRERILPLARWFGRVVAIGRLWRMQRDMWRG